MKKSCSLKGLNDLFPAPIVTTIASATERHEYISTLFRTHELEYKTMLGADYRGHSIESLITDRTYAPTERFGKITQLTAPEVGCAMSHRMAWTSLLSSEEPFQLVLEDDVSVIEKNIPFLGPSITDLPRNWDILYLGYNKQNTKAPMSFSLKLFFYTCANLLNIKRTNLESYKSIYMRPFNKSWNRAGCFNGAHAYAISRKAATWLINHQTPIRFQSDIALNNAVRFGNLNCYCMKFDIFDQRQDIPSLIGDRPSWHFDQ
jgi:glycosyl transferase family 25